MTPSDREITAMVALYLGLESVAPGDRLVEDLGCESADVVNIIAAVEERYSVEFEDVDLLDLSTVGDLVELVRSRG